VTIIRSSGAQSAKHLWVWATMNVTQWICWHFYIEKLWRWNSKTVKRSTRQGISIQVLPLPKKGKGASLFEGAYYVTSDVMADTAKQL